MLKKLSIIALSIIFVSLSSNLFAQKKTSIPVPKRISGGVLNGKAVSLPKPVYPAAARAASIKGSVSVAVVISKRGSIMSARAVSGHPLLRNAAVSAARRSNFAPTYLSGQPVEVSGVIVYNFTGSPTWTEIGMEFGFAESKGLRSTIQLSDGFENEQEQIDLLSKDSTSDQSEQLATIASTIKSKLTPTQSWKFDFGRARAKTLYALNKLEVNFLNNTDKSEQAKDVLQSLEVFRNLSINVPEGIEDYRLERISYIIKIADSGRFNREDKENLIHFLRL